MYIDTNVCFILTATLRSSLSERIASPAYSSRRRANSQKQKAPRLSLWKEQMQYMHSSSHSKNPPVSNSSLQSGHPQLATIPSSHSVSTDRQSTTFAVVSPREPQHKLHLQIIKSEPPPMGLKKEVEYNICDRVLVDGGKLGQIKSIGQQPQWGAGTFYGIRLAGKNGACDGSWKGLFYIFMLHFTNKLQYLRSIFLCEEFFKQFLLFQLFFID